MISKEAFFGRALRVVTGSDFKLNPDRARFYTVVASADLEAQLWLPATLRHWRAQHDIVVVLNQSVFNVDVVDANGTSIIVLASFDTAFVSLMNVAGYGTWVAVMRPQV